MKILRVISSMNPATGGPCQGIRYSIKELTKLGVHNEVLSFDSSDAEFLSKEKFQVHAIGPAKGPWGYSEKLQSWLTENFLRFDVIIVHGLWQYYGYAVQKHLSRLKSKGKNDLKLPRLFIMPHGMLDPYFQRAKERKLKAVRNWLYWKLIEKKLVAVSDGILFTCEAELLLAREPFRPYRPKKEINTGYGIETPPPFVQSMHDAFANRIQGNVKQGYLLFLSRIHEKKGAIMLLQAYKQLLTDQQTSGLTLPKLVIAGPGLESTYGELLKSFVASFPILSNYIIFTGMLTGDAKWGAFYGCDGFILPSHQENFGIAVVEAMACGKPVLISNKVNIWREISTGNAGLVEPDTIQGTKKLLYDWAQKTSGEKKYMGDQSKKVFEENFAIASVSARLLNSIAN